MQLDRNRARRCRSASLDGNLLLSFPVGPFEGHGYILPLGFAVLRRPRSRQFALIIGFVFLRPPSAGYRDLDLGFDWCPVACDGHLHFRPPFPIFFKLGGFGNDIDLSFRTLSRCECYNRLASALVAFRATAKTRQPSPRC